MKKNKKVKAVLKLWSTLVNNEMRIEVHQAPIGTGWCKDVYRLEDGSWWEVSHESDYESYEKAMLSAAVDLKVYS